MLSRRVLGFVLIVVSIPLPGVPGCLSSPQSHPGQGDRGADAAVHARRVVSTSSSCVQLRCVIALARGRMHVGSARGEHIWFVAHWHTPPAGMHVAFAITLWYHCSATLHRPHTRSSRHAGEITSCVITYERVRRCKHPRLCCVTYASHLGTVNSATLA